ncbi:MAG: hypothetical protein Kow0010_21570 [Dehalococcoidia bacterium]
MLTVAVIVLVSLALGSRILRSAVPSESLLATTLMAVAMLALLATGQLG